MPNKYNYDGYTLDEMIADEDRELDNDLVRVKIEYYKKLNRVNDILLSTLNSMSKEEIINALVKPIVKL